MDVWLTIETERALYVDRGKEIILCDRLSSPVTLVVRMTKENATKLMTQLNERAE